MARKRDKRQGLRTHRCYTVDDAARAMAVCKQTVRRWIKTGRIKPIDQHRPAMLAGSDLIALANKSDQPKRRCKVNEAYCLRCHDTRPMAFNEAELVSANTSGANLRSLCGTCSSLMHKWVSLHDLPGLAHALTLTAPLALQHLISPQQPSLHVHFEGPGAARHEHCGEGAAKTSPPAACGPVEQPTSNANTVSTLPTPRQSEGA